MGRICRTRGERGYDAGQEVAGRKRHILVDAFDLLVAVVITVSSVQDRDGAKQVSAAARSETRLENIWADGGDTGQLIGFTQNEFGWKLEIVKRSDDLSGFVVLSRRWIVERTFSWAASACCAANTKRRPPADAQICTCA